MPSSANPGAANPTPAKTGAAKSSASTRPLPGRPSLRYLKLEAKRRLAAGEFPALHVAQLAIAWEYGQPSWTALKQRISEQPAAECQVLPQLGWVITRFRGADQPGWTAPRPEEMQQHFSPDLLAARPAPELIAAIASAAPALREELTVVSQTPLAAQVRIGGLEVFASAAADPPHRLTGLLAVPLGHQITDPRVAAPPAARRTGDVPATVEEIADESVAELGLPGLAMAGGGPGTIPWIVTKGWADLDRGTELDAHHRWPAYCGSALVTTTAVLRLVADGRLTLDTPANDRLRAVRLEDDTITVRELLTHTAGVDSPAPSELLADHVPDLVSVTGPVVSSSGPRGTVRPGNGGYGVLGQLIADVTGVPYAHAAADLVLEPLGLTSSSFPARSADLGPDAVTGYNANPDGTFTAVREVICTIPAIGGLWATAGDTVRLGTGWATLLPAQLAREAVTPHTAATSSGWRMGLGWLVSGRGDLAVHAGAAPPASTFLRLHIRDGQVQVALTNRSVPLGPLSDRLLRVWTPAAA
ncbi:MAG TPA: serine hydrolase domain-containing protein [Streptosporangiaceae bacterium]|nr:serine hydrolase domain-containing protein [Streptosporangiaceae bacterium]